MVSGLVLISPFFLQSRAPWFLRNATLGQRLLGLGSAETLQKRLLSNPTQGIHPAVASAHRHLSRKGVAKRTARTLAKVSQIEQRQELCSILSTVSVPTLLIHGQSDPLETESIARHVVSIVDTGHSPHIDSPELVAKAIEGWRRSAV